MIKGASSHLVPAAAEPTACLGTQRGEGPQGLEWLVLWEETECIDVLGCHGCGNHLHNIQ